MQIIVGKVPGDNYQLEVPDGITAGQAVEIARQTFAGPRGIGDVSGYDIRVNGEIVTGGQPLKPRDTILLTKMVKGN